MNSPETSPTFLQSLNPKNNNAKLNLSSGFFLIDKPVGPTSQDVLTRLKRTHHFSKIGHTGTLDPFASGLLVVFVGDALKFLQYLDLEPKKYQATLQLGMKTDTLDLEGEVLEKKEVSNVGESQVLDAFQKLLGKRCQVPPMYSAKKIGGEKLYNLARKGVEIERKPAEITIHDLKLLGITDTSIRFEVTCSGGTYVRVLGEEIAELLGTIGHLTQLRRIGVGGFQVAEAVEELKPDSLQKVEKALTHLSSISVSNVDRDRLFKGQKVSWNSQSQTQVTVFSEGVFLGIGQIQNGQLTAQRMINPELIFSVVPKTP